MSDKITKLLHNNSCTYTICQLERSVQHFDRVQETSDRTIWTHEQKIL